MKTLLLTSNGSVIDYNIVKIINKPPQEIKVAYVTTASMYFEHPNFKARRESLERHIKNMKEQGISVEEVDIKGKMQEELKFFFTDKDVVYVAGGNNFYLLKAVRESGFDIVINELIEKGVVYAGASAGAYLACPTIEMAIWKQEENYEEFDLKDLKALDLVPFLVFVHYSDELKDIVKKGIENTNYPVRILTDGQGLLVKDEVVEFIGEGCETKL